jgi:hypothetical protein
MANIAVALLLCLGWMKKTPDAKESGQLQKQHEIDK